MKRGLAVAMALQGALGCSPASIASAPPGAGGDAGVVATADGGDAGIGVARACADSAFARCSLLESCSKAALAFRFGDLVTCQGLYRESCTNINTAPSSGQTAAGVEACVPDLEGSNPKWSCGDYLFVQNPPPDCQQPSGALADGAACALPQQCKSGFCSVALGKMCGTCAPALQQGDSCAGLTTCPRTLSCDPVTQKCENYVSMGGACSPGLLCAAHLTCVGYSAQTNAPGTCQLAAMGGACSFEGAGCDMFAGLACNAQTQTCATASIGMPGSACGLVANQQAYCSTSGDCFEGACRAAAREGEPCDLASGPNCIALTQCIVEADGGTAGTCQVPSASNCR
jgi:hypothetical protein